MTRLMILILMMFFTIKVTAGGLPLNPEFNPIGGSFSTPLGVRNAGDGSNRLFVIERSGRIRLIDPSNTSTSSIFLDITSLVDTFFEGGLLGLAFHPDYANNGFFYVNYTRTGTGGDSLTTVIARYEVDDMDPDVADVNSGVEIITIGQPAGNHNGGDLHFGHDGFLYIALGDGGASSSTSQNISNLLGKMLRIDPSVEDPVVTAYEIPASNPFIGSPELDEIWAIGFRNPYRFSMDRDTGDILIADVGAGSREEIDFQSATSMGGENYGWNCREGSITGPGNCTGTFVDPVLEYSHTQGRCSITGGYRYRGQETTWYGSYLYADFCTGEIFLGTENTPGVWSSQLLTDVSGSIFGFGEAEDGRIFYTTSSQVVEINDADFDGDLIFMSGFDPVN